MSKVIDYWYGKGEPIVPIMYSHGDVMKLLAHARELETMLRNFHERWHPGCPVCGVNDGHDCLPDCQLARLLE